MSSTEQSMLTGKVPPKRNPTPQPKKTKKPKGVTVSSAAALSVYQAAVKDDLTYDEMLKMMIERFGYTPTKDATARELAQARIHRLNSYLRSNFDGHELETLRGSPYLPKSSRRLRELFREAITQIDRKKKK